MKNYKFHIFATSRLSPIPLEILMFFVLILSACEENAIFDAGENTILTFQVDSFATLEIKDVFDIVLQTSEINKIEAEGGSNLLDNFKYVVKDNTLFIDDDNSFRWTKGYDRITLTIYTTSLSRINIRTSCSITTNGAFKGRKLEIVDYEKFSELNMELDVEDFRIFVSSDNAGLYTLTGSAKNASFRPWGSSFIFASDLYVKKANVHHSSIGDCYVNASEKLTLKMDEAGVLYYHNSPELVIETHTKGHIIQIK